MNLNVTIKQMKVFVEVARALSFARAADILHLSQPAISLAIQNLEQNIGGKLFTRSTRNLDLTPEGKQFYPIALRLLADWNSALEDVHNLFTLNRGKLHMAVMPSFGANVLPQIIALYHQRFPHINLSINNIVMDDAIENVRKQRCELAVTFAADNLDSVHFTPLYTDTFTAIYSDQFASLNDVDLMADWNPLFEHPMVVMNATSSVRRWLDEQFEIRNCQVNRVAEVNQLETLGRFVAKGIGVGIVPSICSEQMKALGLNMQTLSPDVVARQVGIVTSRQGALSQPAEHMVQLLLEQLSD